MRSEIFAGIDNPCETSWKHLIITFTVLLLKDKNGEVATWLMQVLHSLESQKFLPYFDRAYNLPTHRCINFLLNFTIQVHERLAIGQCDLMFKRENL